VRAPAKLAAAALLLAAPASYAVQPDEVLQDARLEARARALSANLRCLVCQNQSIDDSDAPLARDLRILLRERLMAGDSDAGVQDFIVQRYGTFVLLKPPITGETALLWGGPFLVLAIGALALFLTRRRQSAVAAEGALTAEEQAALDRLLGDKN
jgi:cytochrome c-type biogenesis protein CcmH